MNKLIISGRLTKSPKDCTAGETSNGKKFLNFSVAVQRDKDNADFFSCTAWNDTAANIVKYLNKGSRVLLSGSMQSDKYTDKNGVDRIAWVLTVQHCEFLDQKQSDGDKDKRDEETRHKAKKAADIFDNAPSPDANL